DVARSAGAIVATERLAQRFLQLGREVTRNDVRGTSGSVRHEELDRSIRIRVGGLRKGRERQHRGRGRKHDPQRRARKVEGPMASNGSESIHVFPCDAMATVHHTPQVAHRTNTACSPETCRSGTNLPGAAAFVRDLADRYHRPSRHGRKNDGPRTNVRWADERCSTGSPRPCAVSQPHTPCGRYARAL